MKDDLTEFLRAAAERPFSWGEADCLMWLADWILRRRGVDPAEGWRGRYTSPVGAAHILKQRGGIVAHLDQCLAPFGIERTMHPRRGDVAVVDAPEGLMGAIVVGDLTAAFGAQSIFVRRTPIVAAWSI